MVTVARIMVDEIAVLYAVLKPVKTAGEAVNAGRLRGPASITVWADMALVNLETSPMSLLTSRFPPIETAMALELSELSHKTSYVVLDCDLPSCQRGKGRDSCQCHC